MFRTRDIQGWRDRFSLVSIDHANLEARYIDPATNDAWIEYWPLGHDRCAPQFRRDTIPTEISELLRRSLLSGAEEDWEGVAHHLSGVDGLSTVVESLRQLIADCEIRPRAMELFRRYYSPRHDPIADRSLRVELDQLTRSTEQTPEAKGQVK